MKLRKMLGNPLGAEAKELMSIIETQSKLLWHSGQFLMLKKIIFQYWEMM